MDSTATSGYPCEIDGTDNITGADGDVSVALGDDVDTGGTTVWVWTGEDEDTVDDESELFRLDISEDEAREPATAISVTTEHGGEKAHLGSSVLYTVQLVDKNGDPAVGYKGGLPFTGVALFDDNGDLSDSGSPGSGVLPQYQVGGNDIGQFAVADSSADAPTGSNGAVIFSTEDGVLDAGDIFVAVEPAAKFAVVDDRGASSRVTVTVTDQYGDPIPGIEVRVDSTDTDGDNDATEIVVAGRYLSVGRGGSYSFGYERDGKVSTTETLTATIDGYDHDGDPATAALVSDTSGKDALVAAGSATVEWAVADDDGEDSPQQIRAFDTEMNEIFAGQDGQVQFVSYDSNDRFNIDRPAVGDGDDPPDAAASYAEFERALSKDEGYTLTWSIEGRGSRATNEFNLIIPAPTE